MDSTLLNRFENLNEMRQEFFANGERRAKFYPSRKCESEGQADQNDELCRPETISRIDRHAGQNAEHEEKKFNRASNQRHWHQRDNERRIRTDEIR